MKKKKTKPKKLTFLAQDLGAPLDNLVREDIYNDSNKEFISQKKS